MKKSTVVRAKKTLIIHLVIMSMMFILIIPSFSQTIGYKNEITSNRALMGWSEDVVLTMGEYPYIMNPKISVQNNYVHVVWDDKRHGTREIYYRKSIDYGGTWENEKRLTFVDQWSYNPTLAVSGSNVYVAWQDLRGGLYDEIYFKKSTDNGDNWTDDTPLTSNDGYSSEWPDIAVDGDKLHLVWGDWKNDNQPEIYYMNSSDDGESWSTEKQLTFWGASDTAPKIAVNASNVHVVWTRYLPSEMRVEVFYRKSTDGGLSWKPEQQLTVEDGYNTFDPRIAINGSNIYIVYGDEKDSGVREVYFMKSTDNGDTWSTPIRLSELGNESDQASIAIDENNIHVVWYDTKDGNREIYYRKSINGGDEWLSQTRLTYALNSSIQPDVAVQDSYTHVVWMDNRTGDRYEYRTYYKRSPDFASNISLTANPNSLPADGISTSIITATVTNKTGSPIEGLNVSFRIESGSGTLLASYNYTDSTGKAKVIYQAGDVSGNVVVDVSADGVWDVIVLLITNSPVGWSEDIKLTSVEGAIRALDPCIALYDNNIHVVWNDKRYGNHEIFYKRSINNGALWNNETRLTSDDAWSDHAIICNNGYALYAVWVDTRSGFSEIYYKKSTDNGDSWTDDTPLTSNDGYTSQNPGICVWHSNIHVVWEDRRASSPTYEIYYKKSEDNGESWSDDERLTYYSHSSTIPKIAANASNLHIVFARYVYYEPDDWWCWESYYMRSEDNGENWTEPILITPRDGKNSVISDIAISGTNIYVVLHDIKDSGIREIYFTKSTNNGDNWSTPVRLSDADGYSSDQASIAINGNNLYVVWTDEKDGCPYSGADEIYYVNSADGGNVWSSPLRSTTAPNDSLHPAIAVNNNYIHVVWQDNRTGGTYDYHIYYKRSPDIASNISLTANPSSLPADGISTSVITAAVTNKTGSPIEGLNVSFRIDSGSGILLSSYNYTDSNGVASVAYRAGTISGNVVINASIDGIWNITTIALLLEGPANISLAASLSVLIADGTSTSLVTATVTNETGDPIEGVTVNFIIESGCGSLSADSDVTDVNGNATTIYTAGTTTVDAVIKASANGIINTTTIILVAGDPAHISISASPNTIIANGMSSSTVTVIVTDLYGNPVLNIIVYFVNETGLGSINPGSNTTDDDGITTTIYTVGTRTGVEIINVTCDGVWNTTSIYLVPGPITEIFIYPVDLNLYVGDNQQFTVVGYDRYGNLNISWNPYWHTDGNIGTINDTGFFTATKKGSGAINCSDNVTEVYNISVINVLNTKPVLETVENQTAYEGQLLTLQINATDPDNDALIFSDDSTLFSINTTTGVISFTPSYDSAGIYWVNITITDGEALVWQIFKLEIINVNREPVAIVSLPQNNSVFLTSDNISFDASASYDPDADPLTFLWLSNISGVIGDMSKFNTTLPEGGHSITLVINDSYTESSTTITVIINKPSTGAVGWVEEPGSTLIIAASATVICGIAIAWLIRKRIH